MAHLQDYEDARTEGDKAFAALACSDAKNANAAAWDWAKTAMDHARNAGLCTWDEAWDVSGDGRRPDTAAMAGLFERGSVVSGPVRIRNFTPHDIVIHCEDGTVVRVKSEGRVEIPERVMRTSGIEAEGGGIVAVVNKEYGEAELPDIADDEIIVVGRAVLDNVDHPRVFATDTGPGSAVRNAKGQVVGIRRLQK